jgi:FAD binding domain
MASSPFESTRQTWWTNFHKTIAVKIADLFRTTNPTGSDFYSRYNSMTASIQAFIQREVLNKGLTMRAYGSSWSWTEVNTTTGGILVDTSSNSSSGMDLIQSLSKKQVLDSYSGDPEYLILSQCGKGIRKLNTYLERTKRSLKTSGASDGQTIVGAMSTGTHGSNLNFGSIHDFVVGMHLITGPGQKDHVWLEKESYPIVNSQFLNSLNLGPDQVIRDDQVFNSALVCFGSFGFVHSVLIETEEIYQMKLIRQPFPFDEKLVSLMGTLDVANFGFPDYAGQELNHLQVVIDPYKFDPESKAGTAIITYGYKLPKISELPKHRFGWMRDRWTFYRYRLHRIWTFFRNIFGGLPNDIVFVLSKIDQYDSMEIPLMTALVLKLAYKNETQIGTLGELFTGEGPPSALAGSSMCVDLSDIERTLKILKSLTPNERPEFAGIFSLRFVKSSKATLACTHFGRVTCVIEADGILNYRTKGYYMKIWKALRAANIPFTFHWGKLNDLDGKEDISKSGHSFFVDDMYGINVGIWKSSRDRILKDPAVRKIFINDTLRSWGLA